MNGYRRDISRTAQNDVRNKHDMREISLLLIHRNIINFYLSPQQRPADKWAYPVKLEYLVAPLTAGIVTGKNEKRR